MKDREATGPRGQYSREILKTTRHAAHRDGGGTHGAMDDVARAQMIQASRHVRGEF